MTVYYYFYFDVPFGSLNAHKIKCLSERDSDGKVYEIFIGKRECFGGVLLNSEWID